MIRELATELGVTEDALRKFFLAALPTIDIANQETFIAKLKDAREAASLAASVEIQEAETKLAEMKDALKQRVKHGSPKCGR